jgi:hypothetical protein
MRRAGVADPGRTGVDVGERLCGAREAFVVRRRPEHPPGLAGLVAVPEVGVEIRARPDDALPFRLGPRRNGGRLRSLGDGGRFRRDGLDRRRVDGQVGGLLEPMQGVGLDRASLLGPRVEVHGLAGPGQRRLQVAGVERLPGGGHGLALGLGAVTEPLVLHACHPELALEPGVAAGGIEVARLRRRGAGCRDAACRGRARWPGSGLPARHGDGADDGRCRGAIDVLGGLERPPHPRESHPHGLGVLETVGRSPVERLSMTSQRSGGTSGTISGIGRTSSSTMRCVTAVNESPAKASS